MIAVLAIVLTLLLVLKLTTSCSGGAALESGALGDIPQTDTAGASDAAAPVIDGLDALPTPREAAALGNAELPESTRSYWTVTNNFYQVEFGPGVEAVSPDFFVHFTPPEDGPNYGIFDLFRFRGEGMMFGQVHLGFEWTDYQPMGYQGLYIGFADFVNDRWHWRGPLQTPEDFADFAAERIQSNPAEFGSDKLMVYNFSDSGLVLELLKFTMIHPEEVSGDEWLYFIQRTESGEALMRTAAADFGILEEVIAPQPSVEIGRVSAISEDGLDFIVFNRRQSGGDWQVWQVLTDGGTAIVRYSQPGVSLRFINVTPDGEREIVLSQDQGRSDQLIEYYLSGGGGSNSYDMGLKLDVLPIWYSVWRSNFTMAGRFGELGPGQMDYMIMNEHNGFEPAVGDIPLPEELIESGDVSSVEWMNAFFGSMFSLLYSARTAEGTREIYMHQPQQVFNMRNRVLIADPQFDLRYPQMSPDTTLLALIAAQPGEDVGELLVLPSLSTSLKEAVSISADATGSLAWYDPTPPAFLAE